MKLFPILSGPLGLALSVLGLIVVWGAMATVGVLGARAVGLPERPVLVLVSVLFFVLLWAIPVVLAYRIFWADQHAE